METIREHHDIRESLENEEVRFICVFTDCNSSVDR